MIRTRRIPIAIVSFIIGVVAVFAACGGSDASEVSSGDTNNRVTLEPTEFVESAYVVPEQVFALENITFRLRAVERDDHGKVIVNPGDVQWDKSGDVTLIPDPEPRVVTVRAESPSSGNISDAEVTATFTSGHIGKAAIHVTRIPTSPTGPDQIHLPITLNQPPDAVMLDAVHQELGQCVQDYIVGVVGLALLTPNLVEGCSSNEVTVFSTKMAVHYEILPATQWTPETNVLQPVLGDIVRVPLVMWYFILDGDAAASDAHDEVAIADSLFLMNRAGMAFDIEREEPQGINESFLSGSLGGCDEVASKLGSAQMQEDIIHVVYASSIDAGNQDEPFGYFCARQGSTAPVVVLSWQAKFSSTLTHELVHAMALRSGKVVNGGHSATVHATVEGFDQSNLMWTWFDADLDDDRHHLSLGQVFRMSVDTSSWVIQIGLRTGQTVGCQFQADSDAPCPFLCKDIVPVGSSGADYCGPGGG